jgi:hypothetical protein
VSGPGIRAPGIRDIPSWIKAVGALSIILTVGALVLTLRREHETFTVTD